MSIGSRSRDVNEISSEISQLETDLGALELEQKRVETQGDYTQAGLLKDRAEEIRGKIANVKTELITALQQKQSEDLDATQMLDFDQFNETWDFRMRELGESTKETIEKQRKTQAQLFSDYETELRTKPIKPLRPSAQLLALLDTEKRAAKAKKYQEAQFAKEKSLLLKQTETSKAKADREAKISQKLSLYRKKLDLELSTLEQRLNVEMEELVRIRGRETEELLRKYQNSRNELEIAQGIEKHKREGKHTTVAGRSSNGEQTVLRLFNQSRSNVSKAGSRTQSEYMKMRP